MRVLVFDTESTGAYHEQDFDPKIMTYFPRGYITVN
jgi:hypothetical protein